MALHTQGLLAMGWQEMPSRNKYRMFVKHRADGTTFYAFVGKLGALRTARRPNAAVSRVVSDSAKARVINAGLGAKRDA